LLQRLDRAFILAQACMAARHEERRTVPLQGTTRGIDLLGNGLAQLAGLCRAFPELPSNNRLRSLSEKRWLAHQQPGENHARQVDATPRIDRRIAGSLLGTHALRRAHLDAWLGYVFGANIRERQRDAEVGHQNVAPVQQDVLGLQSR
jgi:hypothetical protein